MAGRHRLHLRIVSTPEEADKLADFLLSSDRQHPVVAATTPAHSEDPEQTIIPVRNFIRRTVGFVHTVVLTSVVSYALRERTGSEFSVYKRAIRTYHPGFVRTRINGLTTPW